MCEKTSTVCGRGTQLGVIALTFCGLLAAAAAEGATIAIQITGLNAQYAYDTENGAGTIFDAGGEAGNNGDAAEAAPVLSVDFTRDRERVQLFTSEPEDDDEFFVDFLIENVPEVYANVSEKQEGTANSGGEFGFDLLRKTDGVTTTLLSLTLDTMDVTYDGTHAEASAIGYVHAVVGQDLPVTLGLNPNDRVRLALDGWVTSPTIEEYESTNYVTAFDLTDGTVRIIGTEVPEPGAGLLAAIACGLLGLIGFRRRR